MHITLGCALVWVYNRGSYIHTHTRMCVLWIRVCVWFFFFFVSHGVDTIIYTGSVVDSAWGPRQDSAAPASGLLLRTAGSSSVFWLIGRFHDDRARRRRLVRPSVPRQQLLLLCSFATAVAARRERWRGGGAAATTAVGVSVSVAVARKLLRHASESMKSVGGVSFFPRPVNRNIFYYYHFFFLAWKSSFRGIPPRVLFFHSRSRRNKWYCVLLVEVSGVFCRQVFRRKINYITDRKPSRAHGEYVFIFNGRRRE